jgi:aminopeptidase-like protein
MIEIIKDLTPLNRVMCSSEYDWTIDYLAQEAPFRILSFDAGTPHNGWVIPPKWDVKEAYIRKDGVLVYDGLAHPLGVIALSAPYAGIVDRERLRQHLHFDHRYDDSLTFHFRQQFRSWDRDWGFCVPRRLYDELAPGSYEVSIRTAEAPGYLKMLEWTLAGRTSDCIVVNANLDHPGVANDGLAGVVVGLELFRDLARHPRRFTYKLVLNQGIIGPEYYLGLMPREERAHVREVICLWMLGSRTQLALQESRGARSLSERAIGKALAELGVDHRRGAFGKVMINDEYVWESYGLPTTSISRFPYPEYHSSRDTAESISQERLDEAVAVLVRACSWLDEVPLVERLFEGTICLSNPSYNLYVDPGQVAFGDIPDDERKGLRYLQDLVASLTRAVPLPELAAESGLQESVARNYLAKWQDKGLVRIY